MIRLVQPQAVMVELCAGRAARLRSPGGGGGDGDFLKVGGRVGGGGPPPGGGGCSEHRVQCRLGWPRWGAACLPRLLVSLYSSCSRHSRVSTSLPLCHPHPTQTLPAPAPAPPASPLQQLLRSLFAPGGGGLGRLAAASLPAMYRGLKMLGMDPGAEFKVALEEAERSGARSAPACCVIGIAASRGPIATLGEVGCQAGSYPLGDRRWLACQATIQRAACCRP